MQKGFKPVSVLQLDVDKLNKRNVEQIQKQLYACNVLKIDEVQKFVDQNMVFSCFVEQQNSKILFQKEFINVLAQNQIYKFSKLSTSTIAG